MVNGKRCEDGYPDGCRYLIALPEPPVRAADSKRRDDSDQRSDYRADHGVNEQSLEWPPAGCNRRWVKYVRQHAPGRGARRSDVGGVALGGGVSGGLCLRSGPAIGANERMPTAGLVTFTLLRSASSDIAGLTLGSAPDSTGSLLAITTWAAM